jgi:hypothetical protein
VEDLTPLVNVALQGSAHTWRTTYRRHTGTHEKKKKLFDIPDA